MTNKRENLIGRLRGNLSGWKETVNEIIKEDIFDENGVVDAQFITKTLEMVNEAMDLANTTVHGFLL